MKEYHVTSLKPLRIPCLLPLMGIKLMQLASYTYMIATKAYLKGIPQLCL